MEITASMVKELREMTGAGMMDCKKALAETDGNMEEARDYLRKKGQAKAEKKAARIAAEGLCRIAEEGDTVAVVEVNSETDFVAKNDMFKDYVAAVAAQALKSNAADIDGLMAEKWNLDESKTVSEALVDKIAVIGEKLSIRRFTKVQGGVIGTYTHGGGKICVIVQLESDVDNEAIREMAHNLGIQIAVLNPQYVSRNDISAEEVAHLRDVTVDAALNDPASLPKPILNKLIETAKAEKKWSDEDIKNFEEHKDKMQYVFNFMTKEAPVALAELAFADKANILADKIFGGMIEGRISKQYNEICLLDQVYVKAEDGKQTVGKFIEQVAKENGAKITVKSFVRYETGEGIEKKEENFAEEVAKQMNA